MSVIVSKMLDTKSPLIYFEENKLKKAGPAKYGGIGASVSVLARQRALDNEGKFNIFLIKRLRRKLFWN